MSSKLFFVVFALAILLFGSFHALFYLRVVRPLELSQRLKRAIALFLALNFTANILYLAAHYSDAFSQALYYLFSLSLGVTFVLFLHLLLHTLFRLFLKTLPFDNTRREALQKGANVTLALASAAYASAAALEGAKMPKIKKVKVGLGGIRLVHITDFHIGGIVDEAYVKVCVDMINRLDVDIIAITGDLIDAPIEEILPALNALERLKSRHGIYYVLGNHEYYHDLEGAIDYFRQKSKIRLLVNEIEVIDTLRINVVGVTDLAGYRFGKYKPDLQAAYCGMDGSYKTILLAHQPRFINHLHGFCPDLILSGHTHGGQIWPFGYAVLLQQPYLYGLHALECGAKLYVGSGIGFWGPPMRLGASSEIAVVE